jgi:hypothetical protein
MLFVCRGYPCSFRRDNLVFLESNNFYQTVFLDRSFIFYFLLFAFLQYLPLVFSSLALFQFSPLGKDKRSPYFFSFSATDCLSGYVFDPA